MPPTHLVDANEGSRLTGLSPATLYKLARLGKVRSYKVLGTALRFDEDDLRALITERPRQVVEDRL